MLMFILTAVLLLALVGSLRIWPHRKDWGFYHISGVAAVILIILFLLFANRMK
jgi:hypothetical protein